MSLSSSRLPHPPRRRWLVPLLSAVLLALLTLGALGWARARYQRLLKPVGDGPARLFEVRAGDPVPELAARLEQAALIRDAGAFRLRARQRKLAERLKAGWYELSPAAGVDPLLDKLVSGKVATRRVTFPEGFTLAAMAKRCEEAGFGPAALYRRLATAEAAGFNVRDLPAGASLEGYLYPATYNLPLNAGPRELIEAQVAAFVKAWREASASLKPARPRHELVTMASLIEREVRVPDERARVAGVIANRLAKDMRLEIDATVIYALGEHRPRLLYRDLEVDSPYNTYRRKGLPPGPIANPGKASLAAALRPEQHDFLYYVLTAGGRHLFSRTWAEHLRAKAVGERMRRSQ